MPDNTELGLPPPILATHTEPLRMPPRAPESPQVFATISRNGERNCSTPLKSRRELPENVALEATPQHGVGNHCDNGGPLVFSETPTMPWTALEELDRQQTSLCLLVSYMETCRFIAYLSCFNIKLIAQHHFPLLFPAWLMVDLSGS